MRVGLIAAAAVLVVGTGCAQLPAPAGGISTRGPSCETLFRELDDRERWTASMRDEDRTIPLAVQPVVGWLRSNDCITYSRDLMGMETAPRELAAVSARAGRWTPGAIVHAGAVTSMGDDARARAYFASLGYPAYSLGTAGLGRRVYVGPLASEGEVQAVLEAARRAGFRHPYVREGAGGSFFGGFVQSRYRAP
jgi:hypothetical protein